MGYLKKQQTQILSKTANKLPEQYHCSLDRNLFPEEELMLAVLDNGIRCARGDKAVMNNSKDQYKYITKEAQEWIANTSYDGLFTFEHICSVLNISPHTIRKNLSRVIDEQRPV